jgi:hypothetical protein
MAEAGFTISKNNLITLLKRTQRMATINGKSIPQVKGAIIGIENDEISTFSIVRDGTSSIACFCADIEIGSGEGESIPVSDISLLIGALSKHSGEVKLTFADNKLKIKSAHKQTTLQSSADAQAFSHTKKTIAEWAADSEMRYRHTILSNPSHYTLKNGEKVEKAFSAIVDSAHLFNAIESGSMNGQKVEHYNFSAKNNVLSLEVGAEGKGKTQTRLHTNVEGDLPASVIGGGLDNVLRTVDGEVDLDFFDLTPYGGGMSLRLSFNGGCIFQREVHK